MGKIHELLAVEPQLKGEGAKILSHLSNLFKQSPRFLGKTRFYTPIDDEGERLPPEDMYLSTTVDTELKRFQEVFGNWIDAAMSKEWSNALPEARSNVIVEGVALFHGVPVTALVNLESRLAEIRKLYASIPVNDPTETWTRDEDTGNWVGVQKITTKMKKVHFPMVAYEATKEHTAQVQVLTRDEVVGHWNTTIVSGMLSPLDRQERLDRLDLLLAAVKEARQRANCAQAGKADMADAIFAYINKGEIIT